MIRSSFLPCARWLCLLILLFSLACGNSSSDSKDPSASEDEGEDDDTDISDDDDASNDDDGSDDDDDNDGLPDTEDECPHSPVGANITLNGCWTPRSDFDRDGDVDQSDFGRLQACLSGPGFTQDNPDCEFALLDGDDDVDADDFGLLQACLSGANISANPECE